MGLLSTVLTDGGGRQPRWVVWLRELARDPVRAVRSLSVRRWSERTIIGLVMQSVDNSLVVSGRRGMFGRWRLTSRLGHGEPSPTWIPEANEAVRRLATVIDGEPGGSLTDLVDSPLTAHFIGGAPIGRDAEHGVIDGWHRVFGHPGLHVVDGTAISANLGVNPSLTITAQAERAMAFWPNRGEPDPRPALGEAYRPVPPVAASAPAVDLTPA
jgi:cholesterol oxidase